MQGLPPFFRMLGLAIVLLGVGLFAPHSPASAHPLDAFYQYTQVVVEPDAVQILVHIYPGPLVARRIWVEATGTIHSPPVDDQQAMLWAAPVAGRITLHMDDRALPVTLESASFPTYKALLTGDEPILLRLRATLPTDTIRDVHQLRYENNNWVERSTFWSEVVIRNPEAWEVLETWEWTGTVRVTLRSLPHGETAEGSQQTSRVSDVSAPAGAPSNGIRQRLMDLLEDPNRSGRLLLPALVIALLLGSLHALTPGHGKALAAAYLVGARGTSRHALLLGMVVTATHTASVYLLGLGVLVASQFVLPERIVPLLEVASGLLILALGLRMLLRHLRGANHAHSHDHSAHPAGGVSRQSLVALGVSGGLVPCPDALALLLVAVALNQITAGLALIVAFSAGLALVLIATGILVVRAQERLRRFRSADRLSQLAPSVSALVVTMLGIAILGQSALRWI